MNSDIRTAMRSNMKVSGNQFTNASLRIIAASALVVTLAFVSVAAFAADRNAHEERAELRIQKMHTKLKITTAQEELWAKVAQTTRDNAKAMDALTQTRMDHAKNMTAVDDLKSYGEITEAHLDGIKKLTPVFADLYASMSDAQKKEADALFRHGDHKPMHQKRPTKSFEAK